nr:hypothetical protein [Bacteroides fragilis]
MEKRTFSSSAGASPTESVNTGDGAPPKYCWNSVMEVIFHGFPLNESGPFCAFSVMPMKAGIAVAASTTEFGKALFSTM